jgi:hypothetical protein
MTNPSAAGSAVGNSNLTTNPSAPASSGPGSSATNPSAPASGLSRSSGTTTGVGSLSQPIPAPGTAGSTGGPAPGNTLNRTTGASGGRAPGTADVSPNTQDRLSELERKSREIDRKVMRSICTGC